VQKLFKQAEKLESDDTEELQQLVMEACQELTLHADIEEELFYPALAAAADDDDQDLVREAMIEHRSARQMIQELQTMSPEDENYKPTFKVLGEYVNHHIEEEENDIFKAAKRAKLDMKELGQEIMQQKEAAGQGDAESGEEMGSASSESESQTDEEEETSGGGGRR